VAQSSPEVRRSWTGAALFSYGFRPFFLFAAIWAVLSMLIWISMLSGALELPTRFDPVSWHAHAFLFGYLGAVLAGFLLTAVPNWTGRVPLTGWPLIAVFALWSAGRAAVLTSAYLPQGWAAVIDLSLPIILGALILREIVAGRNWRNLIILGLVALFAIANALFHIENARGDYAAFGIGMRLGLATAIMMIAVISGRVIPSFTRNWLVQRQCQKLPVPPMQNFDKAVLLATMAILALWVFQPGTALSALLLLALSTLHLMRLLRWQGGQTLVEPLLWVLHVSYAFIPVGALAMGVSILTDRSGLAAAQHLWMVGSIGGMTLAIMTRATLGHTGRPLHADRLTIAIYCALLGAAAARLLASNVSVATYVSGLLWLLSFSGFVLRYAPLLLRPRLTNRASN